MGSTQETCRITVRLSLETAEYSVEEISQRMRMRPDSSHSLGEPRGATGKLWEANVWVLKEYREVPWESHYESIQDAANRLLRRVDGACEEFHQLSLECKSQFLVGTISSDIPGIHLSNNLLRRLATLGVDVEIDIICPEGGE